MEKALHLVSVFIQKIRIELDFLIGGVVREAERLNAVTGQFQDRASAVPPIDQWIGPRVLSHLLEGDARGGGFEVERLVGDDEVRVSAVAFTEPRQRLQGVLRSEDEGGRLVDQT